MAFLEEVARQVQALWDVGLTGEAHEMAELGLRHTPDSGRLLEWLGRAAHRLARIAIARESLEAAQSLVPLSPEGQWALADCHRRENRRELAIQLLEHLATRPDIPDALLPAVAATLGQSNCLRGALDVCRLAATRQPEADEPLFAMAYYMQRLGYDADHVIPMLERAIVLAPDKWLYRTCAAILLARAGKHRRAAAIIASIPAEKLRQVHCARCIARLEEIYERAGDVARVVACRRRLGELSQQRSDPEHFGNAPDRITHAARNPSEEI